MNMEQLAEKLLARRIKVLEEKLPHSKSFHHY
jgi:hypothetical protein